MKNLKKNVVRCFNVLKMNVCDTVPRCILHFFVTQLVDDLDRALQKENLVQFLQERKDIRDKREMCRKQSQALEEALPRLGNKPHKLCSYSPEPRSEVCCFRLNFNISNLVYSNIKCGLKSTQLWTDRRKNNDHSPKFCETV